MKKIFLLVGLLMCLCLPVTMAADWYYVGKNDEGVTYFIDNENVQKSKDEAIVWVKIIEPDGRKAILRWHYKRWDRTVKALFIIIYEANGKVVYSGDLRDSWMPIPPGTKFEKIYNVIW